MSAKSADKAKNTGQQQDRSSDTDAGERPKENGEYIYDVAIIGGGINGVGIARDAAGRGLSVLLCEQDDLASHTSSSSSKLIHGGLRYLEHYEFSLVAKALAEREVLLRSAPHIIWPLRFIMPYDEGLRPAWMIRLGLFLYDHLDFGKRKLLPGSEGVELTSHEAGAPLKSDIKKGFVYSDAWVQDSRLVVLNAVDAAEKGADVRIRTRCIGTERLEKQWKIKLKSLLNSGEQSVYARSLVNATGPWVSKFLTNNASMEKAGHAVRQVKGSHIIVPKMFEHNFAYILQNTDKRIIFALPYEGAYTLIGTTDLEYQGNPGEVKIDDEEIVYLCEACNRYFKKQVKPADVVWSYSGVRPLLDDETGAASEVTRDYTLEVDAEGPPLMSVFGGKVTTYRKLAEEAVGILA